MLEKGSICINWSGSHGCVCQAGWTGDGVNCAVWLTYLYFDFSFFTGDLSNLSFLLQPGPKILMSVQ